LEVLLLTFKALHNLAPPYLSELLHPYTPFRSLRSSSAVLPSVPPFRLSSMGARAFSCSAPRLWNSLPLHIHQLDSITQVKSQIKTHLFKLAYTLLTVTFYVLSSFVFIVSNVFDFAVVFTVRCP
ncbi:hypothetical protein LDENG_00051610, partial [Lucifuga dentata]